VLKVILQFLGCSFIVLLVSVDVRAQQFGEAPAASSPTLTPSRTPTITPTRTPTATPTPVPYVCDITVGRRGGGWNSIYGGDKSDQLWHIEKLYTTIKQGSTVLVDTVIFIDPCNRQYGSTPGCWSWEGSNHPKVSYVVGQVPKWTDPNGGVHNLLNVPLNTAGGTYRTNFKTAQSSFCNLTISEQVSPLVVDLAGRGVQFSDPSKQFVRFDFNLKGPSSSAAKNPTSYAWIKNTDNVAFLALDRNANGTIDSSHELFGDTTRADDGTLPADGFVALANHDSNRDKFIDSQDPVFGKLLLWNDRNHNGISDPEELKPAASTLSKISVTSDREIYFRDEFNNYASGRSEAVSSTGQTFGVYDVWFSPGKEPILDKSVDGTSEPIPTSKHPHYQSIRRDLSKLLVEDGW
jgi:hypothetical protein